jgi:hypothetical protein
MTTAAEYRKAVKDGTLHMLARDKRVSPLRAFTQKRAQPEREIQRAAKQPNKWEAAYARDVLEPRRLAGEIDSYSFEPVTLLIGFDCRYRPDFGVKLSGFAGDWHEFHEVKGFMRDDARVKLVVAASLFPSATFWLATRARNGAWTMKLMLRVRAIMEGR